MSESSQDLAKIIEYMQAHWPSKVKPEWQVDIKDYPAILEKILDDFTLAATKNHQHPLMVFLLSSYAFCCRILR